MKSSPPYNVRAVVTSFYGRQFNSVNDVVIHSDGSIWFTDPTYGYEQGFRPRPPLPSQFIGTIPRARSFELCPMGLATLMEFAFRLTKRLYM